MPETIPTSRTSKGDVLVRMPSASAAAHLRVVAAAAQLAPASPLWLFEIVAHGMPRVEEAEEMLIEGLEKRIGEGGVRSVRWLPSRKREARFGSMMAVLWNDKMVSRITKGNGDLCIDSAVCVRCEKARGRKEMTHGEEAGKPAEKVAGGAKATLADVESMQKGAAEAQEQKEREKGEEKEAKDEPARAKLDKSGGGSLTNLPSLVGNQRKLPIATTTTSSTPTNPFEPVLPPNLADFSIDWSAGDDFGAVLHEVPDSAGASAPSTSDMILVGNSPLSPTLAACRQSLKKDKIFPSLFPAFASFYPGFLLLPTASETTSGIWSHVPTPLANRPTQYRPMPIVDFEPTTSEAEGGADRSWADKTEAEFPIAKAKEEGGEKKEESRKVDRSKKGKEGKATRATLLAKNERGNEGEAKRSVPPRARRIVAPAQKEKSLPREPKNLICLRKNPNIATTDLLLIQEPPRPLKPSHNPNWQLVTPPPTALPDGKPAPIRHLILLSTRLGPAAVTQVPVVSGDVTTLDVELLHGEKIRVVSMYNPCNERGKEVRYLPYNHSVSTILPPLLASTAAISLIVVAGDFNLSHPDWDELVGEPEEAVRTFTQHNLTHCLPPNTITYHPYNTRNRSKPLELVLGSLRAEDRVVSCGLAEDLEAGSNHRPVQLVLALEHATNTPPPHCAFRRTDSIVLERAFLDATARLPTSPLLSSADIDKRTEQLTNALQTAVSAAMPLTCARAGHVVPWWDKELAEASKLAKKAANRAFRLRGMAGCEVEVEFAERERRKRQNEMKKLMKGKREKWDERELAEVKEATLWTMVKKRINNAAPANTTTPPLRKGNATNDHKDEDDDNGDDKVWEKDTREGSGNSGT
ncbi:hypothetical protein NBRC10512_004513 [Rhodotorula toruloides]